MSGKARAGKHTDFIISLPSRGKRDATAVSGQRTTGRNRTGGTHNVSRDGRAWMTFTLIVTMKNAAASPISKSDRDAREEMARCGVSIAIE